MSPRVLIVEDQLPLAKAIAALLTRHNLQADFSVDGIDALKQFSTVSYDLIILDLQLPKLNGIEVLRKVRATARGKDLPVIISTGVYKGEQYAQKAGAAFGIKYYLEKPFSQEAFLAAVKDSLNAADPSLPAPKTSAPAKPPEETKAPEPPPEPPPARAPSPEKLGEIKPRSALMGSLKAVSFTDFLLDCRKKRLTGVFFINKGGDERTILFVSGLPVSIRCARPEPSLGNFLFNQGKLSLMEYQIYQSQLASGTDPEDILIKMGCLSPEEFFPQWRRHLEESLIAMCAWEDAEFTFQLWPQLPDYSPAPPMNLAHVIHQGCKRHYSIPLTAALRKRAFGNYPVLTKAFYDHQMHLNIDPAEAIFLDRIDGTVKFSDLLPQDQDAAEALIKSLSAFMALGMVELRDRPSGAEAEAPFPVRERAAEKPRAAAGEIEEEEEEAAAPEPEARAEAKAKESLDDLIGDLEDTLDDVVVKIEKVEAAPKKPAAAPAAHAPAPAPSAPAPAPAPAAPAEDDQGKREADLKAFMDSARKKNYYEVLGMKSPQQFEFSKMKNEYFRLTKLFSPEKFIMSSGEFLSMSEEALGILATAYNTLSNVVSKEKYDEMLSQRKGATGVPGSRDHDKMQAEVAYQSGLAFLQMDDWDGAEKSMSEAYNLAPKNADVIAHYSWALYNKNKKSRTIQKRVDELLRDALKLKPKCAPALVYRGYLLLDDDKISLAESDFQKALALNPRIKLALKGMRLIEQKKQSEKKGLLGRLMK